MRSDAGAGHRQDGDDALDQHVQDALDVEVRQHRAREVPEHERQAVVLRHRPSPGRASAARGVLDGDTPVGVVITGR